MAENKEPRDEKLIEELYERLWWYTYEASEEEFDEKEVDAITRLLDVLEPVHDDRAFEPGADAALKRFWERYGEEEEVSGTASETEVSISAVSASEDEENHRELRAEEMSAADISSAEKFEMSAGEASAVEVPVSVGSADREVSGAETAETIKASAKSSRSRKWRKRLIRFAIGVAACVVLLISVNVGSYALRKKSFFEIVREEVGRTEITVTGNTEEFETNADDAVECSSWEEVEEIVGEDILEPTYIPDGYKMKSLMVQSAELRNIIVGKYENEDGLLLRIRIEVYQDNFGKDLIQYGKDWSVVGELFDGKVQFYQKNNELEAFFSFNNCAYYVLNDESIEVLEQVVSGMV